MADQAYTDVLDEIAENYGLSEEDKAKLADASPLRKQLAETKKQADRVPELEKQLSARDRAPKVKQAFESYGVDMESLRPAELKALEALDFEGDEPKPEWVAEQTEALGFPMREDAGLGEQTSEPPAAARIAQHATSGPANRGGAPVTTPTDVESWSAEKWLAFKREHPQDAEALMRGEEVTVSS